LEDRVRAGDGSDNIVQFKFQGSAPTTVAQLVAQMQDGTLAADITASDTAIVSGTPINKETLLSEDTAAVIFGEDSTNATVDGALNALAKRSIDLTVPTAAWSSDVMTIEHEAIPDAGSGDVCIGIADDATVAQTAAARAAAPFVGVPGSQVSGSVQYKAEGPTLPPPTDLRLRLTITRY
jgi:hypothetical protein